MFRTVWNVYYWNEEPNSYFFSVSANEIFTSNQELAKRSLQGSSSAQAWRDITIHFMNGKFRFYTRTYDTRNTNLRKINTMETEGRKKKKCNKTFQQKFSISKESARGRFILVESFSGIIISATKNCKLWT